MAEKIELSPSSLNLYTSCPLCFWLQIKRGIKRPEGIFSTLPSGIDYTLKVYFDHWRGKADFPPILKGQIKGSLLSDQSLIKKFRSKSFGFSDERLNLWFSGMLDDAIMLPDESIVPLDNKTRGFPPEEPHEAHILQTSAYTLILKRNGFKTKNLAYIVYYFFNHKNVNLNNPLGFNIAVEEIETNPQRVEGLLEEAVKLLLGPPPKPAPDCEFCKYREIDFQGF